MAYKAYITEALVCGSEDHHTSDRSFLLFSREAGMVWATARSVREERSKQRYALQDFSYARVTLIRGKSGWKIAGAEPIQNVYTHAGEREARALAMRVVQLLRRVIHGETPHPQVFDDVIAVLTHARTENLENAESIIFLRVLHELGYIAPQDAFDEILALPRTDVVPELRSAQTQAILNAVDHALMESQL